ncbi:hypothetical protein TTHERM_00685950 (macronuclear) [Tetrahymena thermophila SB210]|uniref:Uncharacterized protein n=1 Tax=Tetrahymena thermophila (strain SB210) TaxID=312017 RepID=I7MMJ0_TETTS|nr:hypothetical protein TTHERM_00685950 [Tetrahymena thermophila SB210]EAS04952.3 hypothetical protein TTHERM_00685950 [Tetrahymena thermophila SB210]|eukprot:XP_001025197.3 hypothetical protein TTHERM_00685950 [Tetrahymena thermophila SB210]
MSLLQKRKQDQMHSQQNSNNERLLCCLSVMSVVNMTFGNPIYDNYFEGVKVVIGPNRTQSIFNKLKETQQKITSADKNSQSEDDENKGILAQMHKLLGDKINQEIQKRVKLFQDCISSCMKLAQIPQASAELLNILRGKEDSSDEDNSQVLSEQVKQARELIKIIQNFWGEEQFVQLIHLSLRKLNIARDFLQNSKVDTKAKCKGGEMCEEIATSSTLSDENSALTAMIGQQSKEIQENSSKLAKTFKEQLLVKVIPCLSKYQESINHIKTFESIQN